jgi:rod shape-determining protein MreB
MTAERFDGADAAPVRRPGPSRPNLCGVALDLGSDRTRAWITGRGLVLDVPTATAAGPGPGPARQGGTVHGDAAGLARSLGRLLAHRLPPTARPVVVISSPVLDPLVHRAAARSAVQVLRPRSVLTVPGARAVAVAAGADLSRPLLVVDVGARRTELVLLDEGVVADARRVTLGTDGLRPGGPGKGGPGAAGGPGTARLRTAAPGDIVDAVARMVALTLRQDSGALAAAALARGMLVAGGGALRPEIADRLAGRLHVPVDVVPAPHTAAVRGAARLLESARLHPSARGPSAPPGPARGRPATMGRCRPAPPPS